MKSKYLFVIRLEPVKTLLNDVITIEILGEQDDIGFQCFLDKLNLQC